MASNAMPQQVSVEDIERRFKQLSIKASQAEPRYKASAKESRGTGIFKKSPKACERDFMKELKCLENLFAKSQQSKKTSSETQKKLDEFEAFMNSL
ncbi:hypothetical protein PG990_014948 [Apiospora arundinis]